MWQTFITQSQQASSSSDVLFSRLRKAGIDAVSVDYCKKIINALATLEKTQKQGLFYLPFYQALREARESIGSQSLDETLRSFKQVLQIGQAGKANYQYYQQLQTSAFWSTQFQMVRQDREAYHKMLLFHRQWFKESRYAGYSTQGLLWVYGTILPVLQGWLLYANQELTLKQTKLDSILARRYHRFLKRLDLELKLKKQRLREVLYQRLQMGLAFHMLGVEYWILGFITQINAVKESSMANDKQDILLSNPVSPIGTTPVVYQEMTGVIEKEGSPGEITILHASGLCPTTGDGICPIPEDLAPLISSEKPFYLRLPVWLHFLFWGDKVRYEFCQQTTVKALVRQQYLFRSFQGWGKTSTVPIATLETQPEWTTFTPFFKQLNEEYQQLQTAMKKLSFIFHWMNYGILQNYRIWLRTTTQDTLRQQIKALRHYIDKKATQITKLNESLFWDLFHQLEAQSIQSNASLFLELARLRLHIVEKLLLSEGTLLPQSTPLIFQELHADLYRVIHIYETHTALPRLMQASLDNLKTLLQAHEKIRNAVTLKEALMTYRKEIKIERPDLWQRWLNPDTDFVAMLDTVLCNKKYRLGSLEDHQRVHLNSFLFPTAPPRSQERISLLPKTGMEKFITLGKQSLEKNLDDSKKDIADLGHHRTQPDQFVHVISAYLYGFLMGLKNLPSFNAFKVKLPLLCQILDALNEVSQDKHIVSTIERIKKKLNLLEKENDETRPWEHLRDQYLGSSYRALHKTYGAYNPSASNQKAENNLITESQNTTTNISPPSTRITMQ